MLATEGRPATDSERNTLACWSGWGGLSDMFETTPAAKSSAWDQRRSRLRALLTEDEYANARASVLNAHYTHPLYVDAIWQALASHGLNSGNVLEPGCGAGTFIGLAPHDIAMTGVELDPVTARIAQAIYPNATIRSEGYEKTPTTKLFDGAVGNVPFGDYSVYDPANNPGNHSIHNHFIIKALAQTKPGGYVAVITSHHTLDAKNPAARRDMHERADLISAIRLPSGAHKTIAETEVATDLLVFRVRKNGEEPQPFTWEHSNSHTLTVGTEPVPVNDYIMAHPDHVVGTMSAQRGMYASIGLTVKTRTPATPHTVADAIANTLHADLDAAARTGLSYDLAPAPQATVTAHASTVDAREIGSIRHEGTIFEQLTTEGWEAIKVPKTQSKELAALVDLKDRTRGLLALESSSLSDTPEMHAAREDLLAAYTRYTDMFGPLNRAKHTIKVTIDKTTGEEEEDVITTRPPVFRIFRKDPYAALTRAIEDYDEEAQAARPAPLLQRRQVFASYTPKGADTAEDALAISLDQKGTVDLDYCRYLLDLATSAQARDALGTLVFDAPDGVLVRREEYLSGNVRAKLAAAKDAALQDDSFHTNIEALQEVLPDDLGIADISVTPGVSWIPLADYQEFMSRQLRLPGTLTYNPNKGFKVEGGGRFGVQQQVTWGTKDKIATDIFADLLSSKEVKVTHKETVTRADGSTTTLTVVDRAATEAAQGKAQEIADAFQNWIWREPERARRLIATYNERFNSLVPRSYDEAGQRLQLPGLASTFTLRAHQRAAIARMIAEPTCGLFHEVGAGKTLEMVCGVMEQKRLGLITKPMVVVPNHMLGQFEREWLQAYPHARILTADSQRLSKPEGRHEFFARATTSDWDAVICTQAAFEKIGVSKETRTKYASRERDEIDAFIAQCTDSMSLRRAEKLKKKLESKLETELAKIANRSDAGIVFEQLGVDYLVVDEAHFYKNLSAQTEIDGIIAANSANKCKDLDMKLEWLRRAHGERVATFATATPIANTMGEMWVMTHYLRPDLLEAAGLTTFNEWARTFTATEQRVESTVAGTLKVKQRVARFQNMPELMTMWGVFADVKTRDQLDLNIPELPSDANGRRQPHVVAVNIGPAMDEFSASLTARAERISSGMIRPDQDNFLAITNDGKAMATDYRLLSEASATRALSQVTSPIGSQKIDAVAAHVARIYHESKDRTYLDASGAPSPTPGALQLVFCDQGVPKDGWNLYDQLKELLIEAGVPAEKIAYTHDATSSEEKDTLFAKARNGAISVLIGSTEKMGTGANIQARAIALHHVTAPWRPADLAQRDGRILRQGNQNNQVEIFRYVTEHSFDEYSWQTLERKARFINQIMTHTVDARTAEDISAGTEEASYAQVKAIASGNPLLLEEARLKNQVTTYQARSKNHELQHSHLRTMLPSFDRQITALTRKAQIREDLAARTTSTKGDDFTARIADILTDTRADAAATLTRTLTACNLSSNRMAYINFHRQGLPNVEVTVAGHQFVFGVAPAPRDAYDYPDMSKPTVLVAALKDLHMDDEYLTNEAVRFAVTDLRDPSQALGVIRKLENHATNLATTAKRYRQHADDAQAERDRATAELARPNPYTDRLAAAQAELDAIRRQMSQAAHGQQLIPELDPTPRGIDADVARVRALPLGDTRQCRVASPSSPSAPFTGNQHSAGRASATLR
ncbi:SNF2-related protein [Schaalia hyovaginalis]|uniref:SNF2-related protein n=1 Tax=Schaalia hyovaginalis TaxID=29316 RepID=UPI002A7550F7|nr:SNF2-related protein [Schaalia hyovaginalis]MDY2669350.1 SNF2-related protein [Schaalia hyovaginalis]